MVVHVELKRPPRLLYLVQLEHLLKLRWLEWLLMVDLHPFLLLQGRVEDDYEIRVCDGLLNHQRMQQSFAFTQSFDTLVGIDNVDYYRRRDVLYVVRPEFTILRVTTDVPHRETFSCTDHILAVEALRRLNLRLNACQRAVPNQACVEQMRLPGVLHPEHEYVEIVLLHNIAQVCSYVSHYY